MFNPHVLLSEAMHFSYCSPCCDPIPDESDLKRKGFVLAEGLGRDMIHCCEKTINEAAGYIVPVVKE